MRRWCIGLLVCLPQLAIADAPLMLTDPLPLAPDADGLPRLAATNDVAENINAQLESRDEKAFDERQGCLSTGGNSDWYRATAITFAGPDFLGVQDLVDGYCQGAAHPFSYTLNLTFDLVDGKEIDWQDTLPRAFTDTEAQSGLPPSPALSAIYLAAVRPIQPECEYELTAAPLTFALWLDAQRRAIAISPTSLSYAGTPCIDIVYLTPAQAQTLGAHARLLAALASANPITTLPAQTSP